MIACAASSSRPTTLMNISGCCITSSFSPASLLSLPYEHGDAAVLLALRHTRLRRIAPPFHIPLVLFLSQFLFLSALHPAVPSRYRPPRTSPALPAQPPDQSTTLPSPSPRSCGARRPRLVAP